ncbi:hypothetical protein V8E54_004142 [Elaphomyces granulatus]
MSQSGSVQVVQVDITDLCQIPLEKLQTRVRRAQHANRETQLHLLRVASRQSFSYEARDAQVEALYSLVFQSDDTILIAETGYGKSSVFHAFALLSLNGQGNGYDFPTPPTPQLPAPQALVDEEDYNIRSDRRTQLLTVLRDGRGVSPALWGCFHIGDVEWVKQIVNNTKAFRGMVPWIFLINDKIQELPLLLHRKQCVITGRMFPNVAYLKSKDDIHLEGFWDMLALFWTPEQLVEWKRRIFPENIPEKDIDSCHNLICLSPEVHRLWTKGLFALKPSSRGLTDSANAYIIYGQGGEVYKKVESGQSFRIVTENPETHPLPDLGVPVGNPGRTRDPLG